MIFGQGKNGEGGGMGVEVCTCCVGHSNNLFQDFHSAYHSQFVQELCSDCLDSLNFYRQMTIIVK